MASKTWCLANLLVAGSSLRSTGHLAAKILQRPHCRVASSIRPASGIMGPFLDCHVYSCLYNQCPPWPTSNNLRLASSLSLLVFLQNLLHSTLMEAIS